MGGLSVSGGFAPLFFKVQLVSVNNIQANSTKDKIFFIVSYLINFFVQATVLYNMSHKQFNNRLKTRYCDIRHSIGISKKNSYSSA